MLIINVPSIELFDEANQEFIKTPDATLTLEHSLVSISKWESKYEKPFLGDAEKTPEETLEYIRCMSNDPIDDAVLSRITKNESDLINQYITASKTATTFKELPGQAGKKSSEYVTSELVYYWMVALNIPFECQYWHFNRLMTLIKVTNLKNQPPKKMSRREAMNQNRSLNAQRRAASGL